MSSVLVINAAGRETRVALVEQGHIAEFYLERKKDKGIVGNIYKGRVTRVLPGMQAAFVDIGLDKAAFLYVGDVLFDPDVTRHEFELTEGEHDEEVPEVPEEHTEETETVAPSPEAIAVTSGEATPPEGAPALVDAAPVEPVIETTSGAEVIAAAVTASEAPSGAEVVAAAVSDATPAPTGAEVLAVAVETQGAPVTPPAPAETDKLEAPKTTAPRDVRFKDKDDKNKDRNRDRERKHERKPEPKKQQRIEDLLKVGQEVLVQVSKDPIGTKGARITSHISIPGRHLVFMPTVDHVGISRRIGNEKERRRLRDTVERLRPPGTGFIVRTVAENVPQEKLEADIRFLIEVWNETVRKSEKVHRAGLMHPDLDLILRATRDLFAQDIEKLIIDDREEFERVQRFVEAQDPTLKERVVLHDAEEPIFDAYGIEEEIKRATARKVWLRSGGYLIIDQAEALTAIDVNSGRYVGKKNLEDTIVKINTEAAKEIVYQLRLRNIGGIIICDFIDMEKQQNRDKVFKSLHEALGRDKAKTNVLRISELGLVEMTRKRVRESIGRVLHENCGYCAGQGYVKTATTVAYEIFRELRRSAGAYKDPTMVVQCQPEVANVLQGEERDELRHLMDRFNKTIQVKSRSDFHREQYDIHARAMAGFEVKVAGTQVEYDSANYSNARKPGSNEAKFDRNERGGGERNERGGDRNERGDRNDRGERGGNNDRNERGSRRDRERNRDRNRGNGGGGGGGGNNQNRQQQNQNQNNPRPSSPPNPPPSAPANGGGGSQE
ncbi:MAG: ribonuclease G [Archangium gephyra]|uniref:Ribonuclease G n=1 Tax=Archangium gephyra TaxID=48 RepID=A0A2W5VQ87_9BACT|nr:MAG: ribonuclease G [Archangium gephyra]